MIIKEKSNRGEVNLKIALISATKLSLQPIENAISEKDNAIKFFHLLDSSLITMLKEDGALTERIFQRFKTLCDISLENGANYIQLTCSAFNDITESLKPLYNVPIYRSDEGMVEKAIQYKKIGIVSTFAETPEVLKNYLLKRSPTAEVFIKVNTDLMKAFESGDKERHDLGVIEMIEALQEEVDVIVLAQYSIAHVKKMKAFYKPIITAPDASIELCLTTHTEV